MAETIDGPLLQYGRFCRTKRRPGVSRPLLRHQVIVPGVKAMRDALGIRRVHGLVQGAMEDNRSNG